jgi:hypothetical protein
MRSTFVGLVAGLASLVAADCNGSPALCSRKYSDVTFVGSHDSAFVGKGLADNQYISVTEQLKLGVRYLQSQTHKKSDGTIELCHTLCLEKDAGSLSSYLSTIKTWMDSNKNEVVTLLITNGDRLPASDFGALFVSTGLDQYAYSPGANLALDQWPTLQSMIDSGRRLVVFLGKFQPTGRLSYSHRVMLTFIM